MADGGNDDADPLLSLIGGIYDAAIAPEIWPRVLNRIADIMGARSCHFYVQNLPERRIPIMHATRTDPDKLDEYTNYHIHHNPWLPPLARLPAGSVVPDWRLAPRDELVRTEFYNDFLLPRGVAHAFAGISLKDDVWQSVLAVYRSEAQGAFGPDVLRIAHVLLPHLRRAAQISQRLGLAEQRAEGALASLERMACGVFLLDGRGRVLHANAHGLAIVARRDGLLLRDRELAASLPGETSALRRLIGSAAGPPGLAPRGGGLALSRPSRRRRLALLALPVPTRAAAVLDGVAASVAVFVTDPQDQPAPPAEIWRLLYGLTAKEAEVAAYLLDGDGPRGIADRLSMSFETARTHLKRVMAKTDTHRQSDLVRLLLQGHPQVGDGN